METSAIWTCITLCTSRHHNCLLASYLCSVCLCLSIWNTVQTQPSSKCVVVPNTERWIQCHLERFSRYPDHNVEKKIKSDAYKSVPSWFHDPTASPVIVKSVSPIRLPRSQRVPGAKSLVSFQCQHIQMMPPLWLSVTRRRMSSRSPRGLKGGNVTPVWNKMLNGLRP